MSQQTATPGASLFPGKGIRVQHLQLEGRRYDQHARRWVAQRYGELDDQQLRTVDVAPAVEQLCELALDAIEAAAGAAFSQDLDRLTASYGREVTTGAKAAAAEIGRAAIESRAAACRAAEEVRKAMEQTVRETRDGLARGLGDTTAGLQRTITDLVGGDNPVLAAKIIASLQPHLSEMERRVTARADDIAARQARQLDPSNPDSPLASMQRHVTEQLNQSETRLADTLNSMRGGVQELAKDVKAAYVHETTKTAIATATPLKGISYAEDVHQMVATVAAAMGEEYADVSATTGSVRNCKKGDGLLSVVSLPPGSTPTPRIVLEMSNSKRTDWMTYLDVAQQNRDAEACLGLVRSPDQIGGERLRTLGPRRMLLAYDPHIDDPDLLRAVLQLLRCQVSVVIGRAGTDHLHTAEEKIAEATHCLTKLTTIHDSAAKIRNEADKVGSTTGILHATLTQLLDEASTALVAGGRANQAAA